MKALKRIATPFIGFFLNVALMTSTAQAIEHKDLMWALKNSGGQFQVDIDPLQAYRIQGIAGEDLHLLAPSKGRKVKVAVVDTGIDIKHSALKDFIYQNPAKCEAYNQLLKCLETKPATTKPVVTTPGKKEKPLLLQCREKILVSEKNVYPGDCYGWSILDAGLGIYGIEGLTPNHIIGRPDFTDKNGHGTHVAGTILSVTENVELIPVQVIGKGPNKPLKPFSIDLSPNEDQRGGFAKAADDPANLSERVARGIIYATNAGAEIINLSMGWPSDPEQNSEIIREAILDAQKHNVIIVAAAGNDSTNAILRPCQYKNVICVAASRPDGAIASFSNFGVGVDIAAPGVEILSTIPSNLSSIRLPGYKEYDYLSGTSQATPYVSGVIADMLSRGIPTSEIYPRLILGARTIREETPVLRGPFNTPGVPVNTNSGYKKTVLSGNIDMQASMKVQAQPLILPADKETALIEWDRKSADLSFSFKLKNYWKALKAQSLKIELRSTAKSNVEPAIIKVDLVGESDATWGSNEEKTVKVDLQIRDNKDASLTRMQKELSYQVYVIIDGKTHRQFEINATVAALMTKDFTDADVTTIPFVGTYESGTKLTPVDEIYDNNQGTIDYFKYGKDQDAPSTFTIALVKMVQDHYEVMPTQKIKFEGDLSQWRPYFKIRMDIDLDGESEYIFGILEYLDKNLGLSGAFRNHFYIFDRDMRLKEHLLFDDKRMVLPYQFSWMKVGNKMRPAWVTEGPEVKKRWKIDELIGLDSFENVRTVKDIRMYYLTEDFKLANVEINGSERIVEVIQPTLAQVQSGVVPVLLAKNAGTELKHSYLYTFSVAEIQDTKIVNKRPLTDFNSVMNYRNLTDSLTDRAMAIDNGASEYKGNVWYGPDAHKAQRVTILDLEQKKMYDKVVSSKRDVFDAALLVIAAFQSNDRRGAFLKTNSELEYHDLNSDQISSRSLNRFSFYGDKKTELYFPITILDRLNPGRKLPGIYLTEGTSESFGMKIMTPIYTGQQLSNQIVAPARLSFKAAEGCRALGQPLFLGQNLGYALDYYCGDQLKRVLLKY